METTGKALVDHWSWAAEKGLMNKNTAGGLRAATSQVLSVLDDWEKVDVSKLDVEQTLTRFQNLRRRDFKPKVLETYKSRFRNALKSYLDYIEDPGNWKPRMIERPVRSNGAEKETVSVVRVANSGRLLVDYPFPLRPGLSARLTLPRDLTETEEKRLEAFMRTLVVDFSENGEH